MMKPLKISDELLLDYIDGQLTIEQAGYVEEACKDTQVASRLEELRQIDQLMNMRALEHPSRNFNAKVMSNLHKRIVEPSRYSSRKNGLIVLLLALLTVLIGSFYMTDSTIAVDAVDAINFDQINNLTKVVTLPKVHLPDSINLKILTEVSLFALLILALLLLDRVVLRPFFKYRKAEMQY